MLVQLNSNGKQIEIKKDDFDKFSDDQKRNYTILNKEDAKPVPAQSTSDSSQGGKKKDEGKDGKASAEPAKS